MDLMTLALAKKYINNKVAELITAGWEKKIVTSLPQIGSEKTIYMIEKTDSNGNIYYDEYMYTNGRYDPIGTTKTDLAEYAKLSDLDTKENRLASGYAIRILETENEGEKRTVISVDGSQIVDMNRYTNDKLNIDTELNNINTKLNNIEMGTTNELFIADNFTSEIYEFKNISSKTNTFLIDSENMFEEANLIVYYTDGSVNVFMYNGGNQWIKFDNSKIIEAVSILNGFELLGTVTIYYTVDTKTYIDNAIASSIGNVIGGAS